MKQSSLEHYIIITLKELKIIEAKTGKENIIEGQMLIIREPLDKFICPLGSPDLLDCNHILRELQKLKGIGSPQLMTTIGISWNFRCKVG